MVKDMGVDPVVLRRALRLVHCLQKERGASCAYYVSHHEPAVLENMEKARIDCDRAIQMMVSSKGELKVHSTLMKIRSMVQLGYTGEATERSRHKILVCFNALISSIVHDYFMEKIAMQQRSLGRKGSVHGENEASSNNKNGHGHHRAQSMGNSFVPTEFPSPFAAGGADPSSAPTKHDFVDSRRIPMSSPPESLPRLGALSPITTLPPSSPLSQRSGRSASDFRAPTPGHRRYASFNSPKKTSFQVPENDDSPEMQIARLLNLLACFVKLKESTGVERAVLSSLVIAGKEDSLLLSDLVLEVENQRRLLDELKKLPVGSLRNLVEELVEMSQPLRELQQKILKNFDLKGVTEGLNIHDQDKNVIWELMTVYINKLHALELLIIEEIEYFLPAVQGTSFYNHKPTMQDAEFIAGVLGVDTSNEEFRTQLENMPAEEIKRKLLSNLPCLDDRNGSENGGEMYHDVSVATVNGEIEDPLLLIPNLPASKEWEINLYELKFLRRIGEGAAGTTYLANWTGLQVAVKVASITETGLDGWRTEVQALQKLHHPNVIRLLGSVYHPNPLTFCLVLEYCSGGDLAQSMRYPTAPGFFFKVATGIANGVAYLHSRGIMHRDIKPDNILCDGNVKNGNFIVKVSDFGVATEASVKGDRTAETGTYRWMPPEVIRHEIYSNMADVYSYAILLWQLCTREIPYADLSQIEAAGKVALENARPPFPNGTPASIQTLISKCWDESPDERVAFDQLTRKLPELQKKLTSEEHKWLDSPLGHPIYNPREGKIVDDHSEDEADHPPPPSLKAVAQKRKEDKKKTSFFKMFGK